MSKNNNYKVYVHINKINGKRYYGITCQKVEYRWNSGKGYKKNEHFTNAINKYGWDNFEHIVLFDNLTKEEATLMEKCYIVLYDTFKNGYNQSLGGEGGNGLKHTEEWKQEQSKKMSGENNPMYGMSGKLSPNYGKKHSEETRKKISEAQKGENNPMYGKNNPRARQIYCVELDQYFDTVTEAGKYVGCSKGTILNVLTGKGKTAKGMHWLYAEDVDQENINRVMSQEKYANNHNAIKIYCVELDQYFDSLAEAGRTVGCNDSSISNVLHGRRKTTKGMHWVYAEDVEIENSKVS